jgi:hypothetical protein
MGRLKTVAQLQRQLQYAEARKQALEARQRQEPKLGTGQKNPRSTVGYVSVYTGQLLLIQAPKAGVDFFGGEAALGLVRGAELAEGSQAPRGFKYGRVKATVGRPEGVQKRSALSNRPYLAYGVDAGGATRNSYSAPVSGRGSAGEVDMSQLMDRVDAIFQAKAGAVGAYGRLWFEGEQPLYSRS